MVRNEDPIQKIVQQDVASMRHCLRKMRCTECESAFCVKAVAVAELPTEYGLFRIIGFVNNRDANDHAIVLKGDIGDGENVLVRVHSACLTGDALGSRRCDCGPQLHEALLRIEAEGRGIVLYHQAEGRGIGLANKIRAYVLQDNGLDTVEANTVLGFKADERDYQIPAEMLHRIGVKSVRLMTNNPEKVTQLTTYGIRVVERVAIEMSSHAENERYLKTKKERFGHLLHLSK